MVCLKKGTQGLFIDQPSNNKSALAPVDLRNCLFIRISRIFEFLDNVKFLNSTKGISIFEFHQNAKKKMKFLNSKRPLIKFRKANWNLSCAKIHKSLSINKKLENAKGHEVTSSYKNTNHTRILISISNKKTCPKFYYSSKRKLLTCAHLINIRSTFAYIMC